MLTKHKKRWALGYRHSLSSEKAHAIVMKSELGVSDPFVLNFNPIDTPTEAEKAQTLATKAQRDATLVNAGIISPEEARGALISDKESGYGDISAEAPEMGDLAQLQGLLGPEGGQEPQLGQDKATDSATYDFDPNQKRDKSGQWTAEGGNSRESGSIEEKEFFEPVDNPPDIKKFLGQKYDGYKGQDAIKKLIDEKQGYVPDAFHRDDIGDITLAWGDEERGLCHLINRRKSKGIDTDEFLSNLAEVVEKGTLHSHPKYKNRWLIWHKGKQVSVCADYNGEKMNWIITGFYKKNEPKE